MKLSKSLSLEVSGWSRGACDVQICNKRNIRTNTSNVKSKGTHAGPARVETSSMRCRASRRAVMSPDGRIQSSKGTND